MGHPFFLEAKRRAAVAGGGGWDGGFWANHLRVYRELAARGRRDTGWRRLSRTGYGRPRLRGVTGFRCLGLWRRRLEADLRLDAASVAVPTVLHHAVASQLLAAGVDCLVEKPIAASLAEADDLVALAEKRGRVLQVGHLERFNPAVLAIEPKLTQADVF